MASNELMDNEDEIKGLNEKLLELLKSPTILKTVTSQREEWISVSSDFPEQLDISEYEKSPVYGCGFLHHGSPVTPKNASQYLRPIGVFWDIENCPVPKGRSASAVVQVIRDKFFAGYREAEFIVVCDVYKETKQIIQELNDTQVNLIHVAATYKNAADEKLKQSIRRFADIHGSSAAIVLISGDINFAADLSDLRHRRKMHIILLHNENSSHALILCANEHYRFLELIEAVPKRPVIKIVESFDLLISNLPKDKGLMAIKRRLKQLSDNCGGRVVEINANAAIIRFPLQEAADRALKRMNGELVFDTRITVRSLKEKDNREDEENNSTVELTSEINQTISTPIQMYNINSNVGARSLPVTPHYNSSPPVGNFSWNNSQPSTNNFKSSVFPQTPAFINRPHSTVPNTGEMIHNKPFPEVSRAMSPWKMISAGQQSKEESGKADKTKGMRKIRGTHGSNNQSQDKNDIPRSNHSSANNQGKSSKNQCVPLMHGNQNRDWNGQNRHGRNIRTPSPYFNSSGANRVSPFPNRESNEANDKFFNPINSSTTRDNNTHSSVPIDLHVTNLDQSMDSKELKRIITAMFSEHIMVMRVAIFMQSNNSYAASVKVPSLSDAQYVISQMHRRKIGSKRILISYAHTEGPNPQLIRSQIVMLLQEVPGHKLPLFKFREMYESRFMISVSVSDICKMKDVCIVTEEPNGRMIALHPHHRNTPSPCLTTNSQDKPLELPFCTIHTQKPVGDKGWAEQEMPALPNVMMPLKLLETRIHQLLTSHNGSLPLPTLPNCYEAVFKQPLNIDEKGVPLEHLVSCLSTIELKQGVSCVKYIISAGSKNQDDVHEETKCISPSLAHQLALFSRELVDLLKTAPHCQVTFNKFIPSYHHHFGRQCRVADYGFTKLIDLLEALPHTVQVMGEGNKRAVTLSHQTQIRRFTSDLLRVLKAQASKQITLTDFPTVYARVIGKPFDVVDYGVCDIYELLSLVPEHTVVITKVNERERLMAIPKRAQTPEEMEKTKQFAMEAIELLRHAPQYSMHFNKFVPSYHHHFGHQCRVSDYGFNKLIELFEAIPDVIKIEEPIDADSDRRLSLTDNVLLKVLSEQIQKVVMKSSNGLLISNVEQAFLYEFGYTLKPEFYNCHSLEELMLKLNNTVKVTHTTKGLIVQLIDKAHLQFLGLECRRILMDQSQQCLPVIEFQRIYNQYYGKLCDLEKIEMKLNNIVVFSLINNENIIKLTPLQIFACNLYRVLMKHHGKMYFHIIETAYSAIIGETLNPEYYGYKTIISLLEALPCTVIIKEFRTKKTLYLNKKLGIVGIPLPECYSSPYQDIESGNDSYKSESPEPTNSQSIQFHQDKSIMTNINSESFTSGANIPNIWNELNNKTFGWTVQSNILNDVNSKERKVVEQITKQGVEEEISKVNDMSLLDEEYHNEWVSSVWKTPPKCLQNDDVPPIILPALKENFNENDVSNLLSPMKNLLPATANPLNLCTPSFYSQNHHVIPPHPSELPLPSSSLASKGDQLPEEYRQYLPQLYQQKQQSNEISADSALLGNSIEIHSSINSETYNVSEGDIFDTSYYTTGRKTYPGKQRRLAAQFNESLDLN